MLGLCQRQIYSSCLYLMIRQDKPYFGFHSNDCIGNTTILTQRWYHFAFVYDYSLCTQYIYVNGLIECTEPSRGSFLASEGAMTIGAINNTGIARTESFWTGLIDQVSYVSQAKSATEILSDATLVAHFPFEDPTNYHLDTGPNKMKGVSDGAMITRRNFFRLSHRRVSTSPHQPAESTRESSSIRRFRIFKYQDSIYWVHPTHPTRSPSG